jgi:2'-5' RNA ligase
MSEQLSLLGFDDASKVTDGVFFAIVPDLDGAQKISQFALRQRSQHGLTGAPLESGRFHVSLHGLGEYDGLPRGIVAAATEAAATIAAAPFDVTFDHVMSFSGSPRHRPFVLRGSDGLAALTAFQRTLGVAMAKAGLGRFVKAQYTPHMTLLYDPRSVEEHPVAPLGWIVREFVLVHSLLGQGQHIPLGRWPLRG